MAKACGLKGYFCKAMWGNENCANVRKNSANHRPRGGRDIPAWASVRFNGGVTAKAPLVWCCAGVHVHHSATCPEAVSGHLSLPLRHLAQGYRHVLPKRTELFWVEWKVRTDEKHTCADKCMRQLDERPQPGQDLRRLDVRGPCGHVAFEQGDGAKLH